MSAKARAAVAWSRYRVLLRLDNLFDAGLLLCATLWGWGLATRTDNPLPMLVLLLAALFGLRCAGWLVVNTLALLAYARPDATVWQRVLAVPLSGWAMLALLSTPAALFGIYDPRLFVLLATGGALGLFHLALRRFTPLSAFALAFALGCTPLAAFLAAGTPFGREAGLAVTAAVVWAALLLVHHGLLAEPQHRSKGLISLAQTLFEAEKPMGGVLAGLLLLDLLLLGLTLKAGGSYWFAFQAVVAVLGWQLWYPWDHDHVRTVYRSHLVLGAMLVWAGFAV